MLRSRQGKQKDKAIQHNLPKAVIFKEKLAASGGTRTRDILNKLSYRGSWLGQITHTKQPKHLNTQTDKQVNLKLSIKENMMYCRTVSHDGLPVHETEQYFHERLSEIFQSHHKWSGGYQCPSPVLTSCLTAIISPVSRLRHSYTLPNLPSPGEGCGERRRGRG